MASIFSDRAFNTLRPSTTRRSGISDDNLNPETLALLALTGDELDSVSAGNTADGQLDEPVMASARAGIRSIEPSNQ